MSAVNVLDIDLDIFLDPRPCHRAREGRLSSSEYRAWTPEEVEWFLVHHCNLSAVKPIPGKVVSLHHELFDVWDKLIGNGQLAAPFSVTHLDSHADMGMGDASLGYIMCDLLHCDLVSRRNPQSGGAYGLLEGNYVAFALACGWINDIKYVQHPQTQSDNLGLPDIADRLFRNNDPTCGIIQLKSYPAGSDNGIDRYWELAPPIKLEREVPIEFHDRDTFTSADSFSFFFVAQSPNYTPATSDVILSSIRKFIRPVNL